MNENLVNCRRSTLKFWHVVKFLTQSLTRCFFKIHNMTRCIFLNSKSDALFFSIQNLSLKENFNSKSCFLIKHEICEIYGFHGVKRTKGFFSDAIVFQNLTCRKIFNSKSKALYFHQSKIWRVVKISIQNLTRCKNFIWKSDKFQNVFPEFSSCFSGSDWMTISSVNVFTNLFLGRELKDNACYRVSRRMDNWKLPHVNSSLNVWGTALWQHTIFTEVTDRTLWSIKYGRSAVFVRKHPFENKRKRSLVRIPSFFSNIFDWATRRRAIERSWHLHSIYSILAAERYLPKSWILSKRTMLNRKWNFQTCDAQNIP